MAGRLIVCEGIDGAGKTTFASALENRLSTVRPVLLARFPSSDSPIGKLIRSTFSGEVKIDPKAMAHLFIADGLDRVPVIRKALESGIDVVLDRYPPICGWAYNAGEEHTIEDYVAISCSHLFPKPHVVFLLDLSVSAAGERREKRAEAQNVLYERDLYHAQRLRERYYAYAHQHKDVTRFIDATLSTDDMVKDAKAWLLEMGG